MSSSESERLQRIFANYQTDLSAYYETVVNSLQLLNDRLEQNALSKNAIRQLDILHDEELADVFSRAVSGLSMMEVILNDMTDTHSLELNKY